MIFSKIKATYSVSHSLEIFWKYHKNVKNMVSKSCNMCRENGFCFVDNSNISVDNLFKDKLHLLDSG